MQTYWGQAVGGQGEQPHYDGEPVLPTTIPPGLELLNSAAKQIPVRGCGEYFIYSILGSRLPCLPFSRGVVVWAHSSHPTATRTLGEPKSGDRRKRNPHSGFTAYPLGRPQLGPTGTTTETTLQHCIWRLSRISWPGWANPSNFLASHLTFDHRERHFHKGFVSLIIIFLLGWM
ncbi:Putative protein of unknown function [Podospora comata]|uniref:Uncharacterized protein n=1 Tax=Podospora comata TaxID=48703 RepID=A0ABY6S9L7_PODCO|nr:Putative protein of unknown function [Podospora comata]